MKMGSGAGVSEFLADILLFFCAFTILGIIGEIEGFLLQDEHIMPINKQTVDQPLFEFGF